MSEHLLFLQAAGSDFNTAHNMVAAVVESVRAPQGEQRKSDKSDSHFGRRQGLHPERIVEAIVQAGCEETESLHLALAVHATTDSPSAHVDWVASVAARVDDTDALLETAGVVFAFNTINRIADARRVRLEYSFLRQLSPFQGWVERRLASVTALAYDLSFKYQTRQSPAKLMKRLGAAFERLGITEVPDVFNWLSRSPEVLEGVLEMIESNIVNARVRSDLLKEAIAIGVAARAMPGSGLRKAVEQWLPQESLADSKSLRAWAVPSGSDTKSELVAACRRYSWQVANAAYTITDEQIQKLSALGLSDAELLDLTLATSVFSALAIIEPISAAVAPAPVSEESTLSSTPTHEVQVQLA
jgi:hypothetical protein